MFAEIIINTTAKRLQQTFSYIVPEGMAVRVGSRVLVPFGHRREEGIVVALQEHLAEPVDFTLKPIEGLLSTQTGFQEEMIRAMSYRPDRRSRRQRTKRGYKPMWPEKGAVKKAH